MRRAALALLMALAPAVGAADRHASDFVLERQDRMRGIEDATLVLELLASGVLPWDPDMAARQAADLATLAGGLGELFADTPASRHGPASKAAQSVWQDPGGFLTRMADLEARAFALIRTARDPAGPALLPGQIGDLRAACAACHARYVKR